jgi:D-alanyl-D-alanine carboxypeptidase/D-alanyl-D-alanine-endopeptidase (penicillin-binding protein 4)
VREAAAPAGSLLLAEHVSRPLSELVRAINKPSDNAMTRLLYLQLGRALDGERSEPTPVRADRAVRQWFRRQGIDDAGLVMDNGSGLSRSERLKPAQLEAVIRAGLNSRWAPEWVASLPIVGLDGTMRRRLAGSPAAGQARMKTGTLRNTVALAGTVPDAAGRLCIVAAMLNHDQMRPAAGRQLLDAIADWVSRTRFADPADAVTPLGALQPIK